MGKGTGMQGFFRMIAVLLALTGGALGGLWWWQTGEIIKEIDAAKNLVGSLGAPFTYTSVKRGGFPLAARVTFVQPSITWTPGQDVSLAMESQGSISIEKSLLRHHYRLVIEGNSTNKGRILGQAILASSHNLGNTECDMDLEVPWRVYFQKEVYTPEQWFDSVRKLDCTIPAGTTTGTDNQVLIKQEAGSFTVTHRNAANRRALNLTVMAPSIQYTQAYDKILNDTLRLFPQARGASSTLAQYGAIGVEMNLRLEGPSQWNAAAQKSPMNIDLDHFTFKSALSNSTVKASIDYKPDTAGARQHVAFDFDQKSTITPRGDALTSYNIWHMIEQDDARIGRISPKAAQMRPTDLWHIVQPALPKFAPLGTINVSLAGSFDGSLDAGQGTLELRRAAIDFTPYGLTGSGAVDATKGLPVATGSMRLQCRACASMLNDMAAYAGKLQNAVVMLAPEPEKVKQPSWPLVIHSFKQTLQQIGTSSGESTSDNWVYHFKKSDDGTVMVNGRSLSQLNSVFSGKTLSPNNAQTTTIPSATSPATKALPIPPGTILNVNLTVKSCDAAKIRSIGGTNVTKVEDKGPAANEMHNYQIYFDASKIRPDVLLPRLVGECYKQ